MRHSDPASYARLPKADLHCHLVGTITHETVAKLARRNGVTWDPTPEEVYAAIGSPPPEGIDYGHTTVPMTPAPAAGDVPRAGVASPEGVSGHSLLAVTERVEDLLRDREDFALIGYEAVTAAHRDSGTVHLEIQVEVGGYLRRGVAYAEVVDGLGDGLAAARAETGTSALLIAAIDRSRSATEALQVVQEVVDHPRQHVVGIGLDNLETVGPPERFAEAFDLAGTHGLRRTAHAGEHEPTARNVATCLHRLGCERIDHGYFTLEDDDLVKRVAAEGIPFTCISTTSRRSWQQWRRSSIRRMVDAGVAVVLASDDPAMFPTTLAREYVLAATDIGLDAATLAQIARRSLNAAWVDDDRRQAMLAQFDSEVVEFLHENTDEGADRHDG